MCPNLNELLSWNGPTLHVCCFMLARASTKTFFSRIQKKNSEKIFASRKILQQGHSLAEVSQYIYFERKNNISKHGRPREFQSHDTNGFQVQKHLTMTVHTCASLASYFEDGTSIISTKFYSDVHIGHRQNDFTTQS